MKKTILFLLLMTATPHLFAMEAWQKPAQPPSNQMLEALAVDPGASGKLIVASRDGLFAGFQNGPWEKFRSGPSSQKTNRLLCFEQAPESVFILSEDGAFECSLKEKNCSRFYRASKTSSPAPLALAVDPEDKDHWFLGTQKGLLESDDRGKTWFPFSNFRNEPVPILYFAHRTLFVGAGRSLFLSKDRAHFRRVFSVFEHRGPEEGALEANFSEENPFGIPAGLYQIVSASEKNSLWLATSEGVFKSMDRGLSWNRMPGAGLQSPEVRHLAYSEKTKRVFAGTPKGIFVYDPSADSWEKIYAGLEKEVALGMALVKTENKETLATITPAGFFFYPIFPDQVTPAPGAVPTADSFQKLLRLEPSAWQVQSQAMKFANVKNGKIKRWHAESRIAALLPHFSFGKSFNLGNTIDIDRGGANDPDKYILGPPDKSRRWDAGVSWDWGDFIWSSDQPSIDSREKLMVELRNDILAEVTRIYYERRRLQADAIFNPASTPQEHFEKILRIEELTSLLDGFTGKYFSRKLEEMYRRHPDLKEIWGYHENTKI